MSRQPNRFDASGTHKFAGAGIDRAQPLSFWLNGRQIHGFAGDTVLSAVLAAGIDTVGRRGREAIGLTERFAPAVRLAGASEAVRALPMERLPALPGLELVTVGSLRERLASRGPLGRLRHLLLGPRRSLGLRLDDPAALGGGWRDELPATTIETDTLVVGGGIAGMTAALAAAAAGERVVLVERRPALGGDARFFGTAEHEEAPETAIARLAGDLASGGNITVLLRSEVHRLLGTAAHVHQIELDGATAVARPLLVRARRVVLATGALERLPVFPGNRLPGVRGAAETFHLADRYGVWAGRHALFNTAHNFSYRLALLAKDAGVRVERITDARGSPQSRFIDFCKASGITLAGGLVPGAVVSGRRGQRALSVQLAAALEDAFGQPGPMPADAFIAAGGWQPDISLWLGAGGACSWNGSAGRLESRGTLAGVAMAGAAAGFRNGSACMQSGRSAAGEVRGEAPLVIDDRQIDVIYETPDGPTPVNPGREFGSRSRAFLGAGFGFAARVAVSPRRGPVSAITAHPHGFALDEIAAVVQLGDVPAGDAGVVAAERCIGAGPLTDSGWRLPAASGAATDDAIPAYLAGRFGARPQLVVVAASDGRAFEAGCLVFPSSDARDAALSVGVVIGPAPEGRAGALALLARAAAAGSSGAALFVRDSGGAVPARIVETVARNRLPG